MSQVKISPSLLAADFSRLCDEVQRIQEAGADRLHLDVMDGHFVPNISFGPSIIKAIRPHTDLFFETHLMIEKSIPFIDAFIEAGSDMILIHLETDEPHLKILREIKEKGCEAGIVINPKTTIDDVMNQKEMLNICDQVLLMSVEPGFGGQKFIQASYDRLKILAELKTAHGFTLEVDGGVNQQNARNCSEAGADILVAGTAIFAKPDYAKAIEELKS